MKFKYSKIRNLACLFQLYTEVTAHSCLNVKVGGMVTRLIFNIWSFLRVKCTSHVKHNLEKQHALCTKWVTIIVMLPNNKLQETVGNVHVYYEIETIVTH